MDSERPTPLVEDLEGTRRKLEQWFTQNVAGGAPVAISDLKIPEATGMSNVTLLLDASWEHNGQRQERPCVGRLQPQIERPVFPEYDLAMQYRVMDTLGRETPVKAPPLLGLETDPAVLGNPFYIMERIDGRVPGDMPPYTMGGWLMEEVGPEQRRNLWCAGLKAMAEIHRQDYQALGFDFLERPHWGDTALEQQLSYWENYVDWGLEGIACPTAEEAMAWLRVHQPADEPTRLCWGDARIGNMIFNHECTAVNAVLDWEMVTIGNPLQDLAWWNYLDRFFSEGLNCPRLEGLPDRAETVALWEAETGLSAADYGYYELYAAYRYAVIMSRIMVATGQQDQVAENFAIALLRTVMQEQ